MPNRWSARTADACFSGPGHLLTGNVDQRPIWLLGFALLLVFCRVMTHAHHLPLAVSTAQIGNINQYALNLIITRVCLT